MRAVKHKSGRVLFVTSDERTANNRRDMGWIVERVKMTSREQFVEWCKGTNADMGVYKTGIHKGDFKNPVMRKMWMAWQASRAAIEIEIPPGVDVGRIIGSDGRMMYWIEERTVKSIIESEGLKVKG